MEITTQEWGWPVKSSHANQIKYWENWQKLKSDFSFRQNSCQQWEEERLVYRKLKLWFFIIYALSSLFSSVRLCTHQNLHILNIQFHHVMHLQVKKDIQFVFAKGDKHLWCIRDILSWVKSKIICCGMNLSFTRWHWNDCSCQ